MHVTGMEAVNDLAGGIVQDGRLPADCPLAREGPLIERQAGGGNVRATLIQCGRATRYKVLAALVSDVGFGRSQVGPTTASCEAPAVDQHEPVAGIRAARLRQQPLNGALRLLVLALSKLMLANAPSRIEEIQCWPILVLERAP